MGGWLDGSYIQGVSNPMPIPLTVQAIRAPSSDVLKNYLIMEERVMYGILRAGFMLESGCSFTSPCLVDAKKNCPTTMEVR